MFKKQTPEQMLQETLKRVAKLSVPFVGVYVGMSILSPDNRGYRQLEIVSKLFEPLLKPSQSRLFLLSNKDFVLITSQNALEAIEDVLYQIKSLFADDPMLARHTEAEFQQIFFLDQNVAGLERLIKEHSTGATTSAAPVGLYFNPELLESVLAKLSALDPMEFIHRQSVLSIRADDKRTVFQEYYTSIPNIAAQTCNGCDVTSDRSLFNQLTETLDRRMLVSIPQIECAWNQAISLNMNLISMQTPLFERLLQKRQMPLIVELQVADIFNHFELYNEIKERFGEGLGKILIDSITPMELAYLDVSLLRPDYVKIFWTPKWQEEPHFETLKNFIDQHPSIRVILARCSSEQALAFGKKAGISLYQGYFIDAVLGALCKNACTFGQECSLASCIACRGNLSAHERARCVNPKHLDSTPVVKVI